MKSYNPKQWLRIIFGFHKTDTLRKLLPLLLVLTCYCWLVAFIEKSYVQINLAEHLKNVSIIHTLLSLAISILLVFRTNSAYDRWWEGRKLWGALVNNSRNLAIKLNALLADNKNEKEYFRQLIARYPTELRMHLQSEETRYELDEVDHPEIPQFNRNSHVPNQMVTLIINKLIALNKSGVLTNEALLLVNPEVTSLLDICGACERIKNTPIPLSYSSFIKKFILLYTITLPIGYEFSLGYIIIPVVCFIFYVLASLELIAEEIEEPFGTDDNDLPLDKIAATIEKNVQEILR